MKGFHWEPHVGFESGGSQSSKSEVGFWFHWQTVWRVRQDASQTVSKARDMSKETALISHRGADLYCCVIRSSMSKVEWPGLKPNWWSERRLWKRKDFISTAMMDYTTIFRIGSELIGLQLKEYNFAPFLGSTVMLVHFQADGRWSSGSDVVKRAGSGCPRAAEQDFRTCELMLFGPVAELVSGWNNLLYIVRCKIQSPGAGGSDREGLVLRVRGWRHKIWKQTKNWGIRPS